MKKAAYNFLFETKLNLSKRVSLFEFQEMASKPTVWTTEQIRTAFALDGFTVSMDNEQYALGLLMENLPIERVKLIILKVMHEQQKTMYAQIKEASAVNENNRLNKELSSIESQQVQLNRIKEEITSFRRSLDCRHTTRITPETACDEQKEIPGSEEKPGDDDASPSNKYDYDTKSDSKTLTDQEPPTQPSAPADVVQQVNVPHEEEIKHDHNNINAEEQPVGLSVNCNQVAEPNSGAGVWKYHHYLGWHYFQSVDGCLDAPD